MAPDDRGMKNGGASTARSNGAGPSRQVLKKGPWTAAEDSILMEYVKKHGEGNWNAVQRNSGLMRCGKSCRLRWANHLRPNLKKGAFTVEEERIIIELHAKLGNKWARMAAQLPGRTDNEIKNYWNTRLKRRQRAGLPIYPQELQQQNQQENNNQHQSLLSSSYDPQNSTNYNSPSLSLLDIFNPSTMKPSITQQFPINTPSLCLPNTNNNNIFRNHPKGLSLTLPSSMRNSQFSSLPNNNFSQGLSSNSIQVPPFQQNYPNFNITNRPFTGISSNPNGLICGIGINTINYPSGQSSMPATASSSENTGSDFGSSDNANNYANTNGLSRGNSGLLEDLLEESQTLNRSGMKIEDNFLDLKEDQEADYKGKSMLWEDYGLVEDAEDAILTEESAYSFAHGVDHVTQNKNSESSSPHSPPNSSSGIFMKKEDSFHGNNQADDDIMCLLDNFPLAVPVPEWYEEEDDKNNCNRQSSNMTNSDRIAGNQGEDSKSPALTLNSGTRNHDWEFGGCCWNNMPSFC